MTVEYHPDLFDNGLSELVGVSLNYSICQTEPITHTDASSLSGGGGKRVSLVETLSGLTISDGDVSGSRRVSIPSTEFNSTVQVFVSGAEADLWLAVYDGTRLLFKTDSINNRQLNIAATVVTAEQHVQIGQP